ncbi:TBC1 domain family member 12-like isoform X2 [Xyrichtys novacula]|uniref:TBC1 domain family member 12-like isoform X2 n=1 Tax=Xyrichtys novacula TaxID=13765 RepID=A0AAV1H5J6_XYRNO|nr:TBC1 domain family member 12-like isoform X2 [Xyrichtys novacula]CAJ1081306.1 TBC1 domain family member 12-like isoform X2 [Xyrichtys novacula]
MEDRDDPSYSPVSSLHLHQRHRSPSPSGDVISRGHLQVTCSGEGEEVRASEREEPLTCKLCPRTDDVLPIKCHCDVREAGEDQWAGLSRTDDVTEAVRTNQNSSSCTKESKVNSCHRPVTAGSCGGGASGGADLHLDELADPTRTVMTSNFDPETQEEEGVTSDLQELSSDDDDDDDEAFTTDPPLPPGELCPAPTVTASAIPARSKNTFQSGRRQSAPDQLVQEDGGSESELQSRRPGIVEFFSSRKQRSVSHSVPGWKLFGKVPPKQSPTKEARIIQQEFEARQVVACSSPTHHAAGQQSWRKVEVEPLSTTALILEDRPQNLPAKSAEETQRHREEYEVMVAEAKRKELKEAQRKEERKKERLRQEEQISNNTSIWTNQILPQWDHMKSSRRVRDLWWEGLPPSVRGRVWSVAIGNELNITAELYEIFLCRAREKGRSLAVTQSDEGASPADREASLELITRDVSRTFPSLCVFQKGGPYHDMLQSILGAYTCYRPDVGYVQGMSSMAAMLVLNMEEVDAFISFSNLINRPCQLTFCRVDHQQMLRYFGTFQVFFEDALPRLFLHFRSSGVTPDLYLMDWILSLYTKPLPLDVACRVWDVFFRDGEEFLFRAALGILRMYQDVLLDLDLISIAQFLSRLPDEEQLSDRLFSYISATPILSRNRKWSQVLSSYSS